MRFFPSELILEARQELAECLAELGHETLVMPEEATFNGAISNGEDEEKFARFPEKHQGHYEGSVVTLPNFGDESSAVNAVKHTNVPILVHSYPDDQNQRSPKY